MYSIDRILGISYIKYRLANTYTEDSKENFTLRAGLIADLTR